MKAWVLTLAYCSPLTYFVDLFNAAMIGTLVDCGVLIVVFGGFILPLQHGSSRNENMMKGM